MVLSSRIKYIIVWAFLAVFDVLIYAAIGVALMNYDDKHDDSQSDYGSWGSMTAFDKSASVSLIIWNVINLLALAYIIFSIYKKLKFSPQINAN